MRPLDYDATSGISALVSHKCCGGLRARDDVAAADSTRGRVHGNNEDFDSKLRSREIIIIGEVPFFQTRAQNTCGVEHDEHELGGSGGGRSIVWSGAVGTGKTATA